MKVRVRVRVGLGEGGLEEAFWLGLGLGFDLGEDFEKNKESKHTRIAWYVRYEYAIKDKGVRR